MLWYILTLVLNLRNFNISPLSMMVTLSLPYILIFLKMRRFIFSFCLFLLLCSMLLSNVAKYFIMNSMQEAWCYLWFCVLYIFFFLNTELSLLFQNNSLGHNIFYDMSMTLFFICVHKNTLYTCMKSQWICK